VTTFIATLVFAAFAIPLAWLFARQQQTQLNARFTEHKNEQERLSAALTAAQAERDSLRDRLTESEKLRAVDRASFTEREANLKQRLNDLEQVKAAMQTEFEAAAARIFGEKAKTFTEQNQAQLGQLLDPLRQRIIEFRQSVEAAQKSDSTQHGELRVQLEQLCNLNQTIGKEAKELSSALKGNSQVRGAWGELVLERLLDSAGLIKGENYLTQESLTSDKEGEGTRRLRPDVILRLPEGRHLVIDPRRSGTHRRCQGPHRRRSPAHRRTQRQAIRRHRSPLHARLRPHVCAAGARLLARHRD